MATKLGQIVADFRTSLATALAAGGDTATLQSNTDDDGNALPAGKYLFTCDGNNSAKEYFACDLTGKVMSNIYSVSRQGVQIANAIRPHRVGASIVITDFAHILYLNDLLRGITKLDATAPLEYDATASITLANQLATKAYIDGIAIAGSPDASAILKGISKLSVAPASPTNPIAVGTNDPRLTYNLTANQEAALAGLSGTLPSATNLLVDEAGLTGVMSPYAGFTAPIGWLICNGAAVSRSTYARLFALLNPTVGVATVTIATPAVVSLTAHGLIAGDVFYFTTTGALPTGLAANTRYYVIAAGLTADAFELSATFGGAAINTTGSQSGVHTIKRSPYGVGDGSTTFNLPQMKGNVAVGLNTSDSSFATVGLTGGEKTHTLVVGEMPSHTHSLGGFTTGTGLNTPLLNNFNAGFTNFAGVTMGSAGLDGAHNNLQPFVSLNYIIKT